MPSPSKPRLAQLLGGFVLVWLALIPGGRTGHAAQTDRTATRVDPAGVLSAARPDYHSYISALRPMSGREQGGAHGRTLYMALVRPGASDPSRTDSAPLAGPGVRNDVLYNPASIGPGRNPAWLKLLLDHEYFHARHLAGATSLPLPGKVSAEVERHYFEAAAWGFNVAEARARRYPGLRPSEFREALDRYGEHYAALRHLALKQYPDLWSGFSERLKKPSSFLKTID